MNACIHIGKHPTGYIYIYVTAKTSPHPTLLADYADLFIKFADMWPNGRSLLSRIQAGLLGCHKDKGNIAFVPLERMSLWDVCKQSAGWLASAFGKYRDCLQQPRYMACIEIQAAPSPPAADHRHIGMHASAETPCKVCMAVVRICT